MRIWISAVGFLALIATGCGQSADPSGTDGTTSGEPDVGQPDTKEPPTDTEPTSPFPTEATTVIPALGEGPQIYQTTVAEGDYSFAGPLAEDLVLGQTETEVQRIDELTALALTSDIETGGLFDVFSVFPDTILVLAEGGLFALVEDALVLSPLDEYFENESIQSIVTNGDDLWLATTGSQLFLWRKGFLYPVDAGELELASPALAFGPTINGQPALWVANGDTLLAVVETENDLEIWTEREELALSSIVSDSLGELWGLDNGDLHQRDKSGQWYWWQFENPVVALTASNASEEVWFLTENSVWRHLDGQFREVMSELAFSMATADGTGRLLGVSQGDIVRITPGEEPEPIKIIWGEHIKPLSDEKCGPCHGPKGQGGQLMHTIAQWTEKIDIILFMVSNKNMPLDPYPKLTNAEIATIQLWKEQGFLE